MFNLWFSSSKFKFIGKMFMKFFHIVSTRKIMPMPNIFAIVCSVTKSYPTLCNPIDISMPGFPVLHYLPEFVQTHAYWVGDAIKPSYPLSLAPNPALNLSQHQDIFQWVSSSSQVDKGLELQIQHQSFQWIFRVDFL